MPVDLLMQIREAAGSPAPEPDDLIRDAEMPYAELMAIQEEAGLGRPATLQLLRVQGDALRRMAETESAFWQAEVIGPAVAAGMRPDEILGNEIGDRMSAQVELAILGMYHLQQTQAWTTNLINGVEMQLAAAGLHTRLEHPPGDVLPRHHRATPGSPRSTGTRPRRSSPSSSGAWSSGRPSSTADAPSSGWATA